MRAINELSLTTHPKKAVNLVIGSKKTRNDLKEELDKDLMTIQGLKAKAVKSGMYLGMKFSKEGLKEFIDPSIEVRRARAHCKVCGSAFGAGTAQS